MRYARDRQYVFAVVSGMAILLNFESSYYFCLLLVPLQLNLCGSGAQDHPNSRGTCWELHPEPLLVGLALGGGLHPAFSAGHPGPSKLYVLPYMRRPLLLCERCLLFGYSFFSSHSHTQSQSPRGISHTVCHSLSLTKSFVCDPRGGNRETLQAFLNVLHHNSWFATSTLQNVLQVTSILTRSSPCCEATQDIFSATISFLLFLKTNISDSNPLAFQTQGIHYIGL